jgi:hypothetical protein
MALTRLKQGWGQIDRARKLRVGDPRVFLKAVENADIRAIQFAHETNSPGFVFVRNVYLHRRTKAMNLREKFSCRPPMM